ncbi:MAG TPA: hypothetical protein VFD03_01995 [Clostridia bacterium]|nr:hypothetical protein [Clostridia bacterium]
MSDVSFIISSILGLFGQAFSVMAGVKVFGDFTIVQIAVTICFLEMLLDFILTLIEKQMSYDGGPNDEGPGSGEGGPGMDQRGSYRSKTRGRRGRKR